MYYNQSCAAKGNSYGNRQQFTRTMQRASVNIYKTDNSYELLVFAPGLLVEGYAHGAVRVVRAGRLGSGPGVQRGSGHRRDPGLLGGEPV